MHDDVILCNNKVSVGDGDGIVPKLADGELAVLVQALCDHKKLFFSFPGPSCLADWCSSSLQSALSRAMALSSDRQMCIA